MQRNYFYSPNRAVQSGSPFVFCDGNRSIGKSFGWKKLCVQNFIESGQQFIYARRYASDIDRICAEKTLFDDIAFKFPDSTIEINGNEIKVNNKTAGWLIAVSQFLKYKSASMPKVMKIIFDEYVPEDGRYLGGRQKPDQEPELCLNFYQSVARGDGNVIREGVQFIFIGNTSSLNNPYYHYFGIDKKIQPDTKFLSTDAFCVERIVNENVRDDVAKSKFGKLIEGTRYGEYALNNQAYIDNNNFVEKLSGVNQYVCTLHYYNNNFGVRLFKDKGVYYVSNKVDPTFPINYALTTTDHTPNYVMLFKYSHNPTVKELMLAYSYGCVRFEDIRCKQAFEEFVNWK